MPFAEHDELIGASPSLDEPYTYFHVLHEAPLVCVISTGILFNSGIRLALAKAVGRPCRILVQPAWHLLPHAKDIARTVVATVVQAANLRFTFLCPTIAETQCMLSFGLDALHIHKNAFIDERIFHPNPTEPKRFSAVHVANTEPFKRHHLAWDIRNLALVTYSFRFPAETGEIAGYRDLGFSNIDPEHPDRIKILPPSEVSAIIRASHCGLILSEQEGANNASTEYLMCGIPVVSTPSKGGRNELFDPRHVCVVQPVPKAIEAAVAELNTRSIDVFEIHHSVMTKMREHRRRLITWLCRVCGVDFFAQADANLWIPQFTNKLRGTVRVD